MPTSCFPLKELITLHAGNIVGLAGIRDRGVLCPELGFCAVFVGWREWQVSAGACSICWQIQRLERFTIRPGRCDWHIWAGTRRGFGRLLEHYLGEDLPTIEAGYQQFIHKVAYDEMTEQFQMR